MLNNLKMRIWTLLNILFPAWVTKYEFQSQKFHRFNERPVELSFIFRKIAELYPKTILDVGSGTTALPHLLRYGGSLVTASDNIKDYWPTGTFNRHYYVLNDDILNTKITGSFDLITCISVLEHIKNSDKAVKNLFSLLKPGGHLIMTFPYNEINYEENVYKLPGSSYGQKAAYITQSYSRAELNRWMQQNQGMIVEQEYWQFWDGEFWTQGSQIIPPKKVSCEEKHQITCLLIQKQ